MSRGSPPQGRLRDHDHSRAGEGGNTLADVDITADDLNLDDGDTLDLGTDDDISLSFDPNQGANGALVVRDANTGEDRLRIPIGAALELINQDLDLGGQAATSIASLEGAVTGNQTITDLLGNNLSVSGGQLDAAGGTARTVARNAAGQVQFQDPGGVSTRITGSNFSVTLQKTDVTGKVNYAQRNVTVDVGTANVTVKRDGANSTSATVTTGSALSASTTPRTTSPNWTISITGSETEVYDSVSTNNNNTFGGSSGSNSITFYNITGTGNAMRWDVACDQSLGTFYFSINGSAIYTKTTSTLTGTYTFYGSYTSPDAKLRMHRAGNGTIFCNGNEHIRLLNIPLVNFTPSTDTLTTIT